MKPSVLIAAVLGLLALSGLVTAQVFLHPIVITDIKANGSALSYFNSHPNTWNVNGANNARIVSGVLQLGEHYAPYDADLGSEISKSIEIGSTAAKPTCVSALRGMFYTFRDNGDGGADLTYQCCLDTAGTYSWNAGYCQ